MHTAMLVRDLFLSRIRRIRTGFLHHHHQKIVPRPCPSIVIDRVINSKIISKYKQAVCPRNRLC